MSRHESESKLPARVPRKLFGFRFPFSKALCWLRAKGHWKNYLRKKKTQLKTGGKTGNSTQYLVITSMGKQSEKNAKKWRYLKEIYIYLSILWTGRPGVLRSMGSQSQTRLSD